MSNVPSYVEGLTEICSSKKGARIIYAEDEFFGIAENLIKSNEPVISSKYTEFGKWMDGWETQRKRKAGSAGHDYVIIELDRAYYVRAVCVDTAYFTGNFAPRFSLQGTYLNTSAEKAVSEIDRIRNHEKFSGTIQERKNRLGKEATTDEYMYVGGLASENWQTLIPISPLHPGHDSTRKQYFPVDYENMITHLRFNIFPDGGVARLRVYGFNEESADQMYESIQEPIHALCVKHSNAHFGHPCNLLKYESPSCMADGWETARSLKRPLKVQVSDDRLLNYDCQEYVILELEYPILLKWITIDTSYFKGNCPHSIIIMGGYTTSQKLIPQRGDWETMLSQTKLIPDSNDAMEIHPTKYKSKPINFVKVIIIPDGGLSRVKLYGEKYIMQS